ncbi:MAG: hypothetical protein NTU41_06410 [Chloroflexi bacterium]|nr:hypothetical protein [Chloroflexota bacterium]
MGHLRLGRLPKTRRWIDVVGLLDASPEDTAGIAGAVVLAADGRLRDLASDPSLGYCFWLLTRVAWASRQSDFHERLSRLGINADANTPTLAFISRLTDRVNAEIGGNAQSGHFAELSSLALRRAISETVGQHAGSFFDTNVDTLQKAFQAHSTPPRFGALSTRFFADLFARTVRSLVDRELSHHVGSNKAYANATQSAAFMRALDLHARQSARIMETFAAEWYSKHNWETQGEISLAEAQGFVAIAVKKLRAEFKLGAAGT